MNLNDRIVLGREKIRLRLVLLQWPMRRRRPILDFDFLENAVPASLALRRRSQLMMAQEMLLVAHEEIIRHPEQQHVHEEWND